MWIITYFSLMGFYNIASKLPATSSSDMIEADWLLGLDENVRPRINHQAGTPFLVRNLPVCGSSSNNSNQASSGIRKKSIPVTSAFVQVRL